MAFAVAGALLVGALRMAGAATRAFFIVRRGDIMLADRSATGPAELICPAFKPMTDSDTLVEDETFTAPKAGFLGHHFEIFENPAAQVMDVFHAFLP